MPKYRGESRAVRVYTVCDESRYLIVRNVPALGCGDELSKLFGSYGEIEECMPMDGEVCEPFTDVYWIKFVKVSNARFAKRKLDEFVFLGNRLQVAYAPQFESLSDTKEKLEARRKEILIRTNSGRVESNPQTSMLLPARKPSVLTNSSQKSLLESAKAGCMGIENTFSSRVSSDKEYFSSHSMNETVRLVREKLDKIQSSSQHIGSEPALKKSRVENRRRI